MPNKHGHTECPASITGRWLNPNIVKWSFTQDSTVADAIQCNPSRQTQITLTSFCMDMPSRPQHDLFGDFLNRGGQIHFPYRNRRLGFPWRTVEKSVKFCRSHLQSFAIFKIGHIHAKGSVIFQIDQMVTNTVNIRRFSVWSESHQLVFT